MQQPWPPQSKNGFLYLFPWKKSLKISALEAESSRRRHDSTNFDGRVTAGLLAPFLHLCYEKFLSMWDRHPLGAGSRAAEGGGATFS
jgi:hypothetical protein